MRDSAPMKIFRRCARSGMFATWDVHDYDANDAEADIPWRKRAEQIFLIFGVFWWMTYEEDRAEYTRHVLLAPSWRVQITLLGTVKSTLVASRRSENGGYEPDPNPAKTLLGTVEINWAANG